MRIRLFDYIAIVTSVVAFVGFMVFGQHVAGGVRLVSVQSVDGAYLYPLDVDRTVVLDGPVGISEVVIRGNTAFFGHSDCDDGLCERMGPLAREGDWAACLPNKVFVTIVGSARGGDRETDA